MLADLVPSTTVISTFVWTFLRSIAVVPADRGRSRTLADLQHLRLLVYAHTTLTDSPDPVPLTSILRSLPLRAGRI